MALGEPSCVRLAPQRGNVGKWLTGTRPFFAANVMAGADQRIRDDRYSLVRSHDVILFRK